LAEMGVSIQQDLAGVGANLQDHVNVNLSAESTQSISHTNLLKTHQRAWLGLHWLLRQKGLGATNHFEVAGYVKSGQKAEYADLQLLFIPLLVNDDGKAPRQAHGFQVAISQLRSLSRGRIKLRSRNPSQAPSIRFNYLQHQHDLDELRAGIQIVRKLFGTAAFRPFVGPEIQPGVSTGTDAELNEFIRTSLRSTKHPCGTCRMGGDKNSVVDEQGRVHGVQGLRVVDASIMPSITSGNINAPTLMLAEKIADRIVGNIALQPLAICEEAQGEN
jgi:choline dehydrogenase